MTNGVELLICLPTIMGVVITVPIVYSCKETVLLPSPPPPPSVKMFLGLP